MKQTVNSRSCLQSREMIVCSRNSGKTRRARTNFQRSPESLNRRATALDSLFPLQLPDRRLTDHPCLGALYGEARFGLILTCLR